MIIYMYLIAAPIKHFLVLRGMLSERLNLLKFYISYNRAVNTVFRIH